MIQNTFKNQDLLSKHLKSSRVSDEEFKRAIDYFKQEKYIESYPIFLKLANTNHATSHAILADMFFEGLGVNKDQNKGLYHINHAIEYGSINAMIQKAIYLLDGDYLPKDKKMGIQLLEKACEYGDSTASLMLGYAYYIGDCVERSLTCAEEYFNQARERGEEEAQEKLDLISTDDWYLISRDILKNKYFNSSPIPMKIIHFKSFKDNAIEYFEAFLKKEKASNFQIGYKTSGLDHLISEFSDTTSTFDNFNQLTGESFFIFYIDQNNDLYVDSRIISMFCDSEFYDILGIEQKDSWEYPETISFVQESVLNCEDHKELIRSTVNTHFYDYNKKVIYLYGKTKYFTSTNIIKAVKYLAWGSIYGLIAYFVYWPTYMYTAMGLISIFLFISWLGSNERTEDFIRHGIFLTALFIPWYVGYTYMPTLISFILLGCVTWFSLVLLELILMKEIK